GPRLERGDRGRDLVPRLDTARAILRRERRLQAGQCTHHAVWRGEPPAGRAFGLRVLLDQRLQLSVRHARRHRLAILFSQSLPSELLALVAAPSPHRAPGANHTETMLALSDAVRRIRPL